MKARIPVFVAVSFLVAAGGANAQRVDRARTTDYTRRYADAPRVNIWIDRYSYRIGERIRPYFESEQGAYITILRVTTTGGIRVLYPRTPSIQQPYDEARLVDAEVPFYVDGGFYLNEPAGVGFIFAVASFEPFNYRNVASGGRWSVGHLTAGGYEDPYTVINRFINRTLPTHVDFTTDYIQYEVLGSGRYHRDGYVYSDYNDLYVRCMSFYSVRAQFYCHQYAQYGYVPYVIGAFPQRPAPTPATPTPSIPGTPRKAAPRPKTFTPDPMVADEGVKPQTPTQRSPSNEDAQRVWWDLQRREAYRRRAGTEPSPTAAPRINPQTPTPSEFRNMPSEPRIDVRPEPRYEPATQRRYEPAPQSDPQPRFQPAPVQRSDPQPTFHPAPVQRSEPQRRSEPRVEYRPAPAPPPAPPPADRDPAPREVHPAPPPPPPPAAAENVRHGRR